MGQKDFEQTDSHCLPFHSDELGGRGDRRESVSPLASTNWEAKEKSMPPVRWVQTWWHPLSKFALKEVYSSRRKTWEAAWSAA